MSADAKPALDVDVTFSEGRVVGVTLTGFGRVDFHPIHALKSKGLLSVMDCMVLDQIAARVDKLARQLATAEASR